MPPSPGLSDESSAPIQQIYQAFAERDNRMVRTATFGGLGDLDASTVDSAGTVIVVVVMGVRPDGPTGSVAKFFPREWRVVQNEKVVSDG